MDSVAPEIAVPSRFHWNDGAGTPVPADDKVTLPPFATVEAAGDGWLVIEGKTPSTISVGTLVTVPTEFITLTA